MTATAVESAPVVAPPAADQPGLGYVPGLDGLRAVCVLVLLGYHHGIEAVKGGYLAVSSFFTLSGFLIASLALAEWRGQGRLSFGRFWERRVRRLLPAALLAIGLVVLLQAVFEVGSGPRFRGDVAAALGYVANWRFAQSGGDYAAIFTTGSPLQHFWSLAVEEQFYLAFPLLFVAVMRLRRGAAVFAGLALASFAAAWIGAAHAGNSGLTYYATYTRAGEIFAGVTLAFVFAGFVPVSGTKPAKSVGGIMGLAVLAWLWHSVGLGSPALFRGATALNAGATCLVILACLGAGPVGRALGRRPLRDVGKISYGIYLFHWPLFLLLDGERTGLDGPALLAVRATATIAVATASYHLVEAAFRFRLRMPRPRLAAVLAAPAVVVVGLAAVLPVHEGVGDELIRAAGHDPFTRAGVAPTAGHEPVARVLLVGDSVALAVWIGLDAWNEDHPDQQFLVDGLIANGCTLGEPGHLRMMGREEWTGGACTRLHAQLPELVASGDYDSIVVLWGNKDLNEREVAGDWRHLGDDAFDRWFRGQVAERADQVAAAGLPVFWVTPAHQRIFRADDPSSDWRDFAATDNDPARVDRLNELYRDELADRPGFHLVDMGGWLEATAPGGEHDPDYRVDGLHLTIKGSEAFGAWLAPQVIGSVVTEGNPP